MGKSFRKRARKYSADTNDTIKIGHVPMRNPMAIAQAKGEMLRDRVERMSDKIHKAPRNPRSWEDEDWGEDYD